MIGQLVGHYRVLEKIGSGGMGEVFRARDERLGRDVAVKFIRPASSDNPDHLRRFEQEARAAAALNHPNIVAIYDVGLEGTVPYIVSELLAGKNLRQRLAEGAFPLAEAVDVALQIAQGLIAAHERLIVHRDLKPENLFLTSDGRVKILDFGVAKLQSSSEDNRPIEKLTTVTKHGAVVGTVAYMSPEQLRGKPVDHRSDIFSFGAILYEMLSGSRAFRGETEVDTMTAVLREDPPAASLEQAAVPAGYQDIVRHCLEKDPDNRFQSAKDLVFALQTLAPSLPPSLPQRAPASSAAKPRSAALPWSLTALLSAATLILLLTRFFHPPATQPKYRRMTSEAGTVYAARFEPDGRSIVYGAAWSGKPAQLFATVGNSLQAQPLNMAMANLLAVSPTNELAVVVNGTHNGQLETVDGVLATGPLAGSSPRQVLPDVRWADWDVHGQLAVVHYVDGQSRLEFPIGHVLYQTGGWISNIRFSPDGARIAFMDHPNLWDDLGFVSVTDLAGNARTLTRQWEDESGLAWRPDGKEIWFTAIEGGNNLNLMAVDLSGRVHTLLDLPVGLTLQDIAADGRVLVTLNSSRLVMDFTTLAGKEEIDLSSHDWNSARDISPDGQSVLFEDASEAAGPGYSVMLRKVDDSLPIQLGKGSSGGFSPDGKWALSVSTSPPPEVTLLPTGTGQPRSVRLTGFDHLHNGYGRFLDDYRLLVNGDQPAHATRCYVVELSSGKATAFTPEGITCGPSSPDSRFMVGKGAPASMTIYPVDGGAPRVIPRNDPNFNPVQWSSDGSFLFGYRPGEVPSQVYKLEIATGKLTLLKELKPTLPAGVVMVAPVVVSRDGTRFAYSYNQTLSVLYIVSGLR